VKKHRFVSVVALTTLVGSTVSVLPVRAYLFLGGDDQGLCSQNTGSKQHGIPTYPADWPSTSSGPYEGGVTNWFCRTDIGTRTLPSYNFSFTVPVKTPVVIGKQEIEHYSGAGSFTRDLVKVEWDLDGNGSYESLDTGPWITAQGTQNEQVDSTVTAWTTRARYFQGTFVPQTVGSTTVRMRVTRTDSSTDVSTASFTAVEDVPTARIARTLTSGGAEAGSLPVLTGVNVFLSAASSTTMSGVFGKYEWDLDGDGQYETDGGTSSTTTTSFAAGGVKTVGVRVTSRGGSTATASTTIEVRKSPPAGEPGVSILDGAAYTNTKSVRLNLVWPEFATEARISNDGGFAASKTSVVPLASSVNWELDDSVKGIFTKVVYVRFNGSGIDTTKTYQDDVILDVTSPEISSVSMSETSSTVNVAVKATDDLTGVDKAELEYGSESVTLEYSSALSVDKKDLGIRVSSSAVRKLGVSTLRLRVRDGAGNWTAWRTLATPAVLRKNTVMSAASLAKVAGISRPRGGKLSFTANSSICRASSGKLRVLKAGTCRVTFVITDAKKKVTRKTVSLKAG
jgi:hypothetical protein